MPFPYDDPNISMNDIDLKTGQTHINYDKVFKKDGDTRSSAAITTPKSLWSISYQPGEERALRALPGPVRIDDLEHEELEEPDWGAEERHHAPGRPTRTNT